VVVGERQSRAELRAPSRHVSLVVAAPDCIIVGLEAARPHEHIPRTEIALDACTDGRVTFDDLPPGPYRVCIDADDEHCTPVTLHSTQTVHIAPRKH
jgi:hypothetical protein